MGYKIITVSQLFKSLQTVLIALVVILALVVVKNIHVNFGIVGKVMEVGGKSFFGGY